MSNPKLEKKLYLAKESPDSVFDLSDCKLKSVPNVFALIRVFRKESLYLQNNKLSSIKDGGNLNDLSFLKLLDLSLNKITKLPPEIKHLQSLQVLRLDNNEISILPDEIGCLANLEQFSLSSNKLNSLPASIGNLRKLQLLDLRKNKLRSLPSTIYQNRCLESFFVDQEIAWIDPPKTVIIQGTRAILSYFREKSGVRDFESVPLEKENMSQHDSNLERLTTYDKTLQDNLRRLEKEKEEKLLVKVKSEKDMLVQKEKELMLHRQNQIEKQKLLTDVVTEQRKIDEKVSTFQKKRNEDQTQFISNLKSVENTVDDVINQLLQTNDCKKEKSMESLISSLIEEAPVEQSLASRKIILESMEKLLSEEYALMKRLEKSDAARRDFINVSNLKESEFSLKVDDLLSSRRDQQNSLISEIKQDADLQYAAVLMLIEKSDFHNIELQNQITVIQNQLSNLTAVELQNRRLNLDKNISEIAERRITLSELLLQVFEKQQAYQKQLVEQLREIENRQSLKNKNEYWLLQYQRLLNSQPKGDDNLDPALIYELALFGVSHYIPILSVLHSGFAHDYSQITDASLERVGINSDEDRCAILKAVRHFSDGCKTAGVVASAPELPSITKLHLEEVTPSAPSVDDVTHDTVCHSLNEVFINECVICMEKQSNVIFLPCGHLCSCLKCSLLVVNCPLCRCDIERKMQIFTA